MKLLTKNSDYAVRALASLDSGTFRSARAIAEEQEMPYQFLRRILRDLIKERVVVSKEGGSGGFRLNVDPARISVADIIRVFQGDVQFSTCMFRRKVCGNRSSCALRREIKRIEEMVEKELGKITLVRLMGTRK